VLRKFGERFLRKSWHGRKKPEKSSEIRHEVRRPGAREKCCCLLARVQK
jgi:hypothetical protein